MDALAPLSAIQAIPASVEDRWCILRTSGPRTLKLAASLQEAGFDAWTPVERPSRRKPRSRVVEFIVLAMAPTYVFVRERHLAEMRALEALQGGTHPQFSIFRFYGETVYVQHRALHPLRQQQQDSFMDSLPVVKQVTRKDRGQAYDLGDRVKLKSGPLNGFECTVDTSDGLTTTLVLTLFGRDAGVKVSTSQLRADGVSALASAA